MFFLFGSLTRDATRGWAYDTWWAHDLDQEAAATRDVIDFLVARRARFPGMHVYHYNHTERSALERLAAVHGVGESGLATLVETGLFVDLLLVVRNSVQVGAESYGLKHVERLTDFVRGDEIHQGSGAVVEYEAFCHSGDPANLERIAAYNQDDVEATRALRDWLVAHRPAELPWRSARIEPDEAHPDLDAQVTALHACGEHTTEHLLGDLLGYWLREHRANIAPKLAKATLDKPTLIDDPDVITGLQLLERRERAGRGGRPLLPAMVFRYPDQEVADGFTPVPDSRGASVVFATPDGPAGYAGIEGLDREERVLELLWSARSQELGTIPRVVALDDWVPPRPKPEALSMLAARLLDPSGAGPANPVSTALLRADAPKLTPGHAPPDGEFDDDPDRICEWASHLDHSVLAIQGPPGTGKTYRGARVLHKLVTGGMRVGITAMSHHAIDNLLEETIKVFRKAGDLESLRAVRRGPSNVEALPRVTPATDNARCARAEFNLVAGTTWLFASNDMAGAPVEVLVVDEAGQLALADTLAASRSARNLILLGDPLQLPHVSQAQHPGGAGHSVLEHFLGTDTTISPGRGVFLTETRRMHPDVCRFISEEIYEGRLTSAASCTRQQTAAGTGLRWLPADHEGNSTECAQEADIVAGEVSRLIGTTWINQDGEEGPLRPADILVVAPYNDQVKLLRRRLDGDDRTHGVPVGTVDRFQGREAAVVVFTMTTSSADDMPRGPDFLFSRNRLNVAISRARCLAYLVCTDKLLNSRARDLDEMRLIATLCAFVEHSTR